MIRAFLCWLTHQQHWMVLCRWADGSEKRYCKRCKAEWETEANEY